MAKFSERYGYIKVDDIIIREKITPQIENAILDFIDSIKSCDEAMFYEVDYAVWCDYLCEEKASYDYICSNNAIDMCLRNEKLEWFKKIDLLEFILSKIEIYSLLTNRYVIELNNKFAQRNFAYRIIDRRYIEEITSKEEIESITEAITTPTQGVQTHLNEALELLSVSNERPYYRNSIKESISAVECFCRAATGKNTLGDALKELKKKGLTINSQMEKGFDNLYYYTNSKDTGIRHGLMDDVNSPTADEAIYMLVACSAFINYLKKKI